MCVYAVNTFYVRCYSQVYYISIMCLYIAYHCQVLLLTIIMPRVYLSVNNVFIYLSYNVFNETLYGAVFIYLIYATVICIYDMHDNRTDHISLQNKIH